MREGLWARFEALFRAFGWDVVILKYGSLLRAAFRGARWRKSCERGSTLPEPALLRACVPRRRRVA